MVISNTKEFDSQKNNEFTGHLSCMSTSAGILHKQCPQQVVIAHKAPVAGEATKHNQQLTGYFGDCLQG